MNPIQRLMLQKYFFACATCRHLQKSVLPQPACGKQCSGPLTGKNYPFRQSEIALIHHCFVCGGEPQGCMEIEGKWIGICEQHIPMMSSYSSPGEAPPCVRNIPLPVIQ
jgi:hypothetical protein